MEVKGTKDEIVDARILVGANTKTRSTEHADNGPSCSTFMFHGPGSDSGPQPQAPLPLPALAPQGAPTSEHSPTDEAGGDHPERPKQQAKVDAARAWVGPGGGRRHRVAAPSPASEKQGRPRQCCIVLHHGEDAAGPEGPRADTNLLKFTVAGAEGRALQRLGEPGGSRPALGEGTAEGGDRAGAGGASGSAAAPGSRDHAWPHPGTVTLSARPCHRRPRVPPAGVRGRAPENTPPGCLLRTHPRARAAEAGWREEAADAEEEWALLHPGWGRATAFLPHAVLAPARSPAVSPPQGPPGAPQSPLPSARQEPRSLPSPAPVRTSSASPQRRPGAPQRPPRPGPRGARAEPGARPRSPKPWLFPAQPALAPSHGDWPRLAWAGWAPPPPLPEQRDNGGFVSTAGEGQFHV
ncbi:collagen alpha-1(I) chain-like [Trichechus manatus latirostris]|uniref:Collagen alpha-1(I) chain-like n=1 Tax=Trichechus manatus latirostris TaxID=127582 RepID=A0A2Y9FXV0_TRIMA|nr:collagen alpha-1(I) chain-like [Trichechus manatus latirostris]